MKKLISAVLTLLITISIISVNAQTNPNSEMLSGDYIYSPLTWDTAIFVEYVGEDREVELPSKIDGYKIVAIGDGAFRAWRNVKSVVIPNGVRVIGENAFNSCTTLTSVTLPEGLTAIEARAFHNTSLSTVTIPDSVEKIGTGAFSACTKLKSAVIGKGIKSIGNSAFAKDFLYSISGYTDTAASEYAYENNIEFISLGVAQNQPALDDLKLFEKYLEGKNIDKYNLDKNTFVFSKICKSGKYNIYYAGYPFSQPWEPVEAMGDYLFKITNEMLPYQLGLYAIGNGQVLTIKEAYENGVLENLDTIVTALRLSENCRSFNIHKKIDFQVGTLGDYTLRFNGFNMTWETMTDVAISYENEHGYAILSYGQCRADGNEKLTKGLYFVDIDGKEQGFEKICSDNIEKVVELLRNSTDYLKYFGVKENGKLLVSLLNPPTEPATQPPTQPSTEPSQANPETSIGLAESKGLVYVSGKKRIVSAVANPVGKTLYSSSNTKIAKVSSNGVVTGLKAGTATITLSNNGAVASFKIMVKNPTLNKKTVTLKVKRSFTLKIKGQLGKATFKSSNKKIAAVNSKGKINALKKGKATVTVNTNGMKLKCKITVK